MRNRTATYCFRILTVCIMLLTGAHGMAQRDNCKLLLTEANDKINQVGFPQEGQVYHISYEMQNIMRDPKLQHKAPDQQVDILMSMQKLQYKTGDVTIYQDDKDAFMIVHPQRVVYRSNSTLRTNSEEVLGKVKGMRDSLIAGSTVISCNTIGSETELKKITIRPASAIRSSQKISRIEYVVDGRTKNIQKMVVRYDQEHYISRTIVKYNAIDLDYSGKLKKSAYEKVFGRNDQLLPEYQGYKIIDNRKEVN